MIPLIYKDMDFGDYQSSWLYEVTMRQELETTIAFYDEKYAESTAHLDMQQFYDRFEKYLPEGASVLDAGCGSGRDSKHFIEKGYTVTAFDASETMCECASKMTGLEVRKLTFQEMDYKDCFDGIWACASLLHVPENELSIVLSKLFLSLRDGGVLYASWKCGEAERVEDSSGRFFSDMNKTLLTQYLRLMDNSELEEIWYTKDVRNNYVSQNWINAIVKKRGDASK